MKVQCKKCNVKIPGDFFKCHVKICPNDPQCNRCGKTFKNWYYFKRHAKMHLSIELNRVEDYKCKRCEKIFEKKSSKLNHELRNRCKPALATTQQTAKQNLKQEEDEAMYTDEEYLNMSAYEEDVIVEISTVDESENFTAHGNDEQEDDDLISVGDQENDTSIAVTIKNEDDSFTATEENYSEHFVEITTVNEEDEEEEEDTISVGEQENEMTISNTNKENLADAKNVIVINAAGERDDIVTETDDVVAKEHDYFSVKPYHRVCKPCGRVFKSPHHYERHIKIHERNERKELEANEGHDPLSHEKSSNLLNENRAAAICRTIGDKSDVISVIPSKIIHTRNDVEDEAQEFAINSNGERDNNMNSITKQTLSNENNNEETITHEDISDVTKENIDMMVDNIYKQIENKVALENNWPHLDNLESSDESKKIFLKYAIKILMSISIDPDPENKGVKLTLPLHSTLFSDKNL